MNQKELFVCNHISEIREELKLSVIELANRFPRNIIYSDTEMLQTQERWKKLDKLGAIRDLKLGIPSREFVLVDIKSCLERSIKDNDSWAINYFQNLIKLGFKYLSLDGQHRMRLFWEYPDLNEFNKTQCTLLIYYSLSLNEISHLARHLNTGVPWNEVEKNNGYGVLTEHFIEVSKHYKPTLEKFENKKFKRKGERKHISSFLILHLQLIRKENLVVNQKNKKNLENNQIDSNIFQNQMIVYKMFHKLLMTHETNYKRLDYTMYYLMLFLISVDYVENKKSNVPSDKIVEKIVSSFNQISIDIHNSLDEKLNGRKGLFDEKTRAIYANITKRFQYYKNKINYGI